MAGIRVFNEFACWQKGSFGLCLVGSEERLFFFSPGKLTVNHKTLKKYQLAVQKRNKAFLKIWLLSTPGWTVLDCCNSSGVLMSASTALKSVLIGSSANMKPIYSAKVACEKEKEKFSTNFSQTCNGQDEVKRWVTANFVNVSRRVSVICNSTFCSDANLDSTIDSASLNFRLEICVRQW